MLHFAESLSILHIDSDAFHRGEGAWRKDNDYALLTLRYGR